MYIDNNTYFIKTSGLAAGTAWSTLWAIATNISDVVDLTQVTNRRIVEGLWFCIQIGTAFAQAGGTSTWSLVTSAAVGLGTPTVLCTTGSITFTVLVAFGSNAFLLIAPVPPVFALRYIGCTWTPVTNAFTTGTANLFLTPQAPVPGSNVQ